MDARLICLESPHYYINMMTTRWSTIFAHVSVAMGHWALWRDWRSTVKALWRDWRSTVKALWRDWRSTVKALWRDWWSSVKATKAINGKESGLLFFGT